MNAQLENEFVGKIVSQRPDWGKVLERYGIDYCCRGNTRLIDACREKRIELREILEEFELASQAAGENEANWLETSLSALADNIVSTHHAFLREELPRVSELVRKVNSAHGQRHPELEDLEQTFLAMRAELESHMLKEERVLFPAIRWLEAESGRCEFPFGSLDNPIGMMRHEHDEVGRALRAMRKLTQDFTPPSNACPTYRVMLDSLQRLEQDLHVHIHKENNVLFPRAQKLERSPTSGCSAKGAP